LEITKEIYLDYQESYKLRNSEIIEDVEEAWNEDNLNSHPPMFKWWQTLTVLIKYERLSISGIGILMKKIITKGIVR